MNGGRSASWSALDNVESSVKAVEVFANNLFVGGFFPGHFARWDGASWDPMGSGTYSSQIFDFTTYDGSLYAVGDFRIAGNKPSLNIGRWTPNRTGIEDRAPHTVLGVYPNPFKVSTTLRYELDQPSHVQIDVFDIQGRRVATLLDEFREAGPHSQTWTGRGDSGNRLASGVYYLRLSSGEYAQSRKVILVR